MPAARRGDEGFTLIELLVVVIIIGILAGIAIPSFLRQREDSWKRAAESDLRNAAVTMEAYQGRNGTYGVTASTNPTADFKSSDDVTLTVAQAGPTSYCLAADNSHLGGSGADYWFSSADGKPVNVRPSAGC